MTRSMPHVRLSPRPSGAWSPPVNSPASSDWPIRFRLGSARRSPGRSSRRVERQPLPRRQVGDRVLERARLAPLARGPHVAVRADLIDAPVDLEVVAVGVLELDGDLTAVPPAPLEHDR